MATTSHSQGSPKIINVNTLPLAGWTRAQIDLQIFSMPTFITTNSRMGSVNLDELMVTNW
ncbi:hypothetical protein PG993_015066 [Apiospora rasikravindrae]|uniref:Uncharacterized protein n=1 Tax=Apiospora rasikravindrae TaxID=990691 RepID=A0ABR1RPR2_9PEZI